MKFLKDKQTRHDFVTYAMCLVAFAIVFFMQSNHMIPRMIAGQLVPITAYIVMAISLNLVVGIAGDLSLGHAGFMSVGAYTGIVTAVALESAVPSDPMRLIISIVVGAIAAAILGFLIGIPVLRLSGDYLAIVTLAFGEIIKNIMNAVYLGVDDSGLHFSLKDAASMNMAEDGKILINGAMGITGIKKTSTFTMGIILVLITLVVVLNLIRSRAGRAISAIRDNEIAAKSIGINITRYKLMAFVLSSVFAGMAGVLYSLNYSSLVAKKFDYNTSINILVFVVLGGIGSIRGSVIAAAILTVLPEMLRGLNDYRMLIYAIVLIVMMIFTRSPKLVAWRKEVAEKITEKFPILKLNKFLKDKSKKEAA
jgi:branched-chain amino acid transport system permease protein